MKVNEETDRKGLSSAVVAYQAALLVCRCLACGLSYRY